MNYPTGTSAWLSALDFALSTTSGDMPQDAETYAHGALCCREGWLGTPYDLTTPVVAHPFFKYDYEALAAEMEHFQAGTQTAADMAIDCPRFARYAEPNATGGVELLAHGATYLLYRASVLGQLTKGNALSAGYMVNHLGLTAVGFQLSATEDGGLLLDASAQFNAFDLWHDLPYELVILTLAAWDLAGELNKQIDTPEKKVRLGSGQIGFSTAFLDASCAPTAHRALESVQHYASYSLAGSSCDPAIGSRAEQKQAMHFSIEACKQDAPVMANNWQIRAYRADEDLLP